MNDFQLFYKSHGEKSMRWKLLNWILIERVRNGGWVSCVQRDNDGINEFCILTPCPLLVLVTVDTKRTVSVSGGSIGIQLKLLRIREPREIKRKCWLSCTVLLHQSSHRRIIHFQQIVLWRNIIIIFGTHTSETLSEEDEIIFCFCFSFTITPNRCLNLRSTEMSWHSAPGLSIDSFPGWGCYCRCFWLRQRNGYFKFILNKQ